LLNDVDINVPLTAKAIRDDLKEFFRGSRQFDDATRRLFATDASIFRRLPLGVLAPRDEDDLLALVKYASEKQIGLTARGGGTGLAGECLTDQLVVDLTQHFNTIVAVDETQVRVQPGVVARTLQDALRQQGRRLAIDCGSEASCTLGGMLANNASGARVLKHGYLRQYVESMQAIIGTGQRVRLREVSGKPKLPITAEGQMAEVLANMVQQHLPLIETCRTKTSFNRAGYLLHDLLHGENVALQKMLIGAEGTLGIITEATIRTVPLAAERAVMLLGFTSMQEAAELVPHLLESQPAAVELLDRRLVTMACEVDPVFKRWLSPSLQAVLLIEWETTEPGTLLGLVEKGATIIRHHAHPIVERLAMEEKEADRLWSIRTKALPSLFARAQRTPVGFFEDIAVPVGSLASFLGQVQMLFPKHETSGSILSHAGAGIIHLRPLYDLHNIEDIKRLQALTDDIYAEVFRVGGTISAQHGVGIARGPWLQQQVGQLMDLFRQVKTLFDPARIFNPDKLVGSVGSPFQYLRARQIPVQPSVVVNSDDSVTGKMVNLPVIEWEMNWASTSVVQAAESCHGCGACRDTSSTVRMCPIFHAEQREAASPRAKANLLRDVILNPDKELGVDADAVRAIADLCVNCKMCGIECPSHVPIPKLMLEAKAQHVKERGLRWRDWLVSHIDSFASWGAVWPGAMNAMLRSTVLRWTLEKTVGLARQRRLPLVQKESFSKRAKRWGWTKQPTATDRPKVLYFADTYAEYFDPDLAEAVVRVLEAAGVQVYVPPEPMMSGAAALSVGDVERARRRAQRNINTLEPMTREGYTILCSEPTTAVMLKQDYINLVDDPGAAQVARHTVELMWYLEQLREQGRLPEGKLENFPLTLGHHVPCHIKALQQGVQGPTLLEQMASYRVKTIDMSCSGMAGVYGLQKAHFESSLIAGKPMLDRFSQEDVHLGSSECSSCRMQMQHAGRKLTLHPVQWLAVAYGLMPELQQRIEREMQ
jgi:FAD/FMN-containing dehydrogenase/Fe-S oxidoreductase